MYLLTKQVTGLAQIGRINMTKVILYTQYMCAMAFQMMQDILISLWCFSIGLMLEIRAIHPTWMFEFDFAKGTTYTIYMLLLCPCNSITLERICFCLLLCVFDALLDNWKDKLIWISSDSASIMAGALSVSTFSWYMVILHTVDSGFSMLRAIINSCFGSLLVNKALINILFW